MKIKDKNIVNITKYILVLFTCLLIFLMSFVISPEMYGDGREYMLMTESFQNHFSPELLKEDINTATANYNFEFELNRDDGEYPFGFFTNDSGKTYSYHFWLYSLLVLPIKILLKLVNGNQLRCFQIFNALIYIISLWYIYMKYKGNEKSKLFLIMLLMVNPALYYVVWTHTEIFTFSLVCMSLVMYSNKEYEKAIFTVSVAAMQNQAIIFLGGMYFIDYFIERYMVDKKINIKEYFFGIIKKGVFFIPFFIPLIFYYINFGTLSLIASSGYVRFNGLIEKIISLFFDLNQGMLPFIPIVVILYFYIIVFALFKKNIKSILNIGTIIVIMLFCSLQLNWNPGEAGIMRYNVWIIPILIYFIISLKDEVLSIRINNTINKMILLSIFSTGLIIIFTGGFKYKYSNVEFNPLSKYVLNSLPELYNPQEEIFAERALGHEGYSEEDFPIIYADENGNVKKVLMNNNSIGKLLKVLECDEEFINKKVGKNINKNINYYLNFRTENINLKKDIKITYENRKFKCEILDNLDLELLKSNEEYLFKIKTWNLGNQVWKSIKDTKEIPIGLSYHWLDENNNVVVWDGYRSYFEESIFPNEYKIISLKILTPNKSGNYKLKLDIVQENVCWFSDFYDDNYIIDVKID